jgi:Tfp pilus assembly protein PilF
MPQELHYRLIKSDVATAEGLLKKAIELDPQFAGAYFGLADVYVTQARHGW